MKKTFERYKTNLKYDYKYIYSYNTKVAEITPKGLIRLSWNVGGRTTSPTTNKHINYASNQLSLTILKN